MVVPSLALRLFAFFCLFSCLLKENDTEGARRSTVALGGVAMAGEGLRRARFWADAVGTTWKRQSALWLVASLLLAGDIHPNPGPPAETGVFPCTLCGQNVGDDDAAICCDSCEKWSHIWCGGGVSLDEYNRMVDHPDDDLWFCPSCYASELPYRDCSIFSLSGYSQSSNPNTIATPSPECLKCVCLNARSIVNKAPDLKAMTDVANPHVIAVTESFLDDEILNSELFHHDYLVLRRDRNRHGGGVLLAVHTSIPAIRRYDLETDCELLWAELTLLSRKMLVGVYYRPPGSSCDSLYELRRSFSSIPGSQPFLVCGDFNAPSINWDTVSPTSSSSISSTLCDLALDFHLTQLVREPTRESHILDLLLTSDDSLFREVTVTDNLPGTDHSAVRFSLATRPPPSSAPKRTVFNFKKANFDEFREKLSNASWDDIFRSTCVNEMWLKWKNIFLTIAEESIPKLVWKPGKRKSWLSKESRKLIKKKRKLYRKARRSDLPGPWVKFRETSNCLRTSTRRDHQSLVAKMTTNIKSFWRWVKNLKTQANVLPEIHYKNKVIVRDSEKAKAFNEYFCSVFTEEDSTFLHECSSGLPRNPNSIDSILFSTEDVFQALCKIDPRKSSGPDTIPGRLLKEGAPFIAEPLARLFTHSLETGVLPEDWTTAYVTPIHKKEDKRLPQNYRPISLTSLVVKVMERLVSSQLAVFLDANGVLSPLQHGFRPGHSCLTQLLQTIHDWAHSLDRASSTHVIFIDFAKAFDSIPHERLLLKLEAVGLRGDLLNWLRGFLVGRMQKVVINGCHSPWKRITSGVPQGTILGPLLFNLYINDISACLTSGIRLYADDCAVYREILTLSDCVDLQHDLNAIHQWTVKWQMKVNPAKCKAMQVTNKRNPIATSYILDGSTLDWVTEFRYLGVTINEKLSWTLQCQGAAVKANRMLGLLKRSMKGSHLHAKLRAYKTLVRPHLEFAVQAWSPHYQKDINTLEKVQRRAVRWISGSSWDHTARQWSKPYDQCLLELGLPTLSQRRLFLINYQVFKIIYGLDCIPFFCY